MFQVLIENGHVPFWADEIYGRIKLHFREGEELSTFVSTFETLLRYGTQLPFTTEDRFQACHCISTMIVVVETITHLRKTEGHLDDASVLQNASAVPTEVHLQTKALVYVLLPSATSPLTSTFFIAVYSELLRSVKHYAETMHGQWLLWLMFGNALWSRLLTLANIQR